MLDKWLGFKIHHYLQALGLFILAVGVPLNKVLMSIGTIWLAANLLIKADFKNYWKNWKNSIVFWFVVGVFILSIFGLLYTTHFDYAFRYLNWILPFFVIPISLIGYPIEKRWLHYILFGFLTSLLITSLFNFNYLLQHPFVNYRAYSLFGSHIRYALCIVMGVLVALFLFLRIGKWKWLMLPLIGWFTYYTYISEVDSGYVAYLMLLLAIALYFIQQLPLKILRYSCYGLGLIIVIGCVIELNRFFEPALQKFDFSTLPKYSTNGEEYQTDTTVIWFENGYPISACIAPKALKKAWNKRANINFNQKLNNGYKVQSILIRYMTSKGLTKDSLGMTKMSDADIKNVEKGMVSIVKTYGVIHQRLANLKNQVFNYVNGGNSNGNSLLQRFEHWKAARNIIRKHWAIGVGTGDVQAAFDKTYIEMHSGLSIDNRKRAHNQYLTFWITFGIIGFVFFTGFWIWFLWKNIRINQLFGIAFTLIAMSSFLTEDTFETQEGITFISLFLSLSVFLFSYKEKNRTEA